MEHQEQADHLLNLINSMEDPGHLQEAFRSLDKIPQKEKKSILGALPWDLYTFDSDSIFKNTLKKDNVDLLKVLLPYTPLHCVNRDYLNQTLHFLEYNEYKHGYQMHEYPSLRVKFLLDRFESLKLELKYTGYWAANDIFDTITPKQFRNYKEEFTIMAKIASTVLAAELFDMGCGYKSMKCLKFLLEQTPGLVHIKLAQHVSAIPTLLMMDDEFMKQEAEHTNGMNLQKSEADTTQLAQQTKESNLKLRKIKELLVPKIKCRGENALHIIMRQLYDDTENDHIFSLPDYVHELLEMGVDPTERNKDGQTVLDVIVSIISKGFFAPRRFKRKKKKPTFMRLPMEQLRIATLCIKLLQTKFAVKHEQDTTIPRDLFSIHARSCTNDKAEFVSWIKQYQSILDSVEYHLDPLLNSSLNPWYHFLAGQLIFPTKQLDFTRDQKQACSACKSLVKLVDTAIRKGMDIEKCLNAITLDDKLPKFYCKTPPELFLSAGRGNDKRFSGQQTRGNDCCYLLLLELFLLHGINIAPLLKRRPSNSMLARIIHHISDPQSDYYGHRFVQPRPTAQPLANLHILFRFCKALILYFPSFHMNLLSIIPQDTDEGKQIFLELCELARIPKPLKIFSKCTIVQTFGHAQINQLPLPLQLKDFLKGGDYQLFE